MRIMGHVWGKIRPTPRDDYDPVRRQSDGGDVDIRIARSTDLLDVAALDVEFGGLTYPYFVIRQLFDVHPNCWLVADHSDGLVGYALGVPGLDRETGWLLGHVVSADYRRRGYGRSLALSSLRIMASAGVRQVCLTVKPSNTVAITLYRKIGFGLGDLHADYLGPGEDRMIMCVNLA
ncbi:MAG: GNAT family N-acetyltransferase [Labedaea sp.]